MPEQLIGSGFPGQQLPVGSVVTFVDRHRCTVFPAVTELRLHEAIVAGGETGRWRVRYAGLQLIKAGPTGGATMQQVEDHAAQLLERHPNTGAPATRWRFRFETATASAGICRYNTTTIALSVSYVLLAPLGRHPRHAPARGRERDHRARPRTRRRVVDRRVAHRLHGAALQHRRAQPEALDGGVPPVPRPLVPSMPDGESTPTLDLSAARLADRLENQRPRGSPLTAATREPACQDCSYDLMIDPMATGTVKRPFADLRRPRGREAPSAHPPTPVDDTPQGKPRTTGREHVGARDPVDPHEPLMTAALGSTWKADDCPMHLHTFEHIVRESLGGWWRAGCRPAALVRRAPLDELQQRDGGGRRVRPATAPGTWRPLGPGRPRRPRRPSAGR